MKRLLLILLFVICHFSLSLAQQSEIEVTLQEAKTLYKNTSKRWISIHDPSVVYEPTSKRYYIFGSHKAGAYTTDMQNWYQANPTWKVGTNTNADNVNAFVTPAVKKVMKGGAEVDFPQFNAEEWSHRTDAKYNVDGNMWAPDVIWNEKMQKWCMYLSINGDAWHSSIILLTADQITGPYEYQGPVVICGFQDSGHSYKGTDLELVLGTQSSLPSRYAVGNGWGRRWPHTIDPAVFYDEEGKLWMVYGSWSGGIWMLELNEETGLRDYDVTYPSTNGSSDGVTSDPYFGTKIGGGYYVSGEGPYIEHIGNYYYLFVSYGFFAPGGYEKDEDGNFILDSKGNKKPTGGYEMRIFRSEKPNGPYKDASNRSAIFTSYVMNYGTGSSDMRGEKILGAYNDWGFQTVGECAQGHNSIIAAEDGRTYLVYHTKFNNGTAGHQVRVHQVFQNKNGWLVAAPFEYNGDEAVSGDVATKELAARDEIPGTYELLLHKYRMDYANFEEVTPVKVTLSEDGKVSGKYSGTWEVEDGTSYLKLVMGGITYNGVIFEQEMDQKSIKTISFSAMANSGVNVWGYKYQPKYALAWQLNNQSVPVIDNQYVTKNIDLQSISAGVDNVDVAWTTTEPEILSEYGRYNPTGVSEDKNVDLTVRISSNKYYWTNAYSVVARSEANAESTANWKEGLLAHYSFDDANLSNTLNAEEKAQLLRKSTTAVPVTEEGDQLRNGNVVHTNFGANGKESYVSMPNPLFGKALEDGATISFYVKRTDNNLWDALFGMTDGTGRLYMTGNLYIGYNAGDDKNWLDINHPNTVQPTQLKVGNWNLVTITFSRKVNSLTGGVTIYVNGVKKSGDRYNGQLDGVSKTTKTAYDYNLLVNMLAACPELYLGNASFWGSADARFDDVMVYDRELSSTEVSALHQMTNRVFNAASLTNGIEQIIMTTPDNNAVYDLGGRKMNGQLQKGLYIKNGKKVIVK